MMLFTSWHTWEFVKLSINSGLLLKTTNLFCCCQRVKVEQGENADEDLLRKPAKLSGSVQASDVDHGVWRGAGRRGVGGVHYVWPGSLPDI